MKLNLQLLLLLISSTISGQIIYSEDFQNQSFQHDIVLYDIDSIPIENLIQFNTNIDPTHWYVYAHPAQPDEYFAWSTAMDRVNNQNIFQEMDNWMILPKISILPNTNLYFDTRKVAINNPNNSFISVLVSTNSDKIEDFTDTLMIITATGGWNPSTVDLSSYENKEIHIAFRGHSDMGAHIGLDNINVISSESNEYDVKNVSSSIESPYVEKGSYDLNLFLENFSSTPIENIDVHYSINGNYVKSSNINDLGLELLGNKQIVVPDFIELNEEGAFAIAVWCQNPNDEVDMNNSNDTSYFDVVVMEEGVQKHVLIEEFTGTWCVWCPRGPIELNRIINELGKDRFTIVAHHNNDEMEIEESKELNDLMPNLATGYPSASFDRIKIDQSEWGLGVTSDKWDYYASESLKRLSSASIDASLDYNDDIRELSIDANVNFVVDEIGDIRINAFVLENKITGFPQANNYNNDPNTYPELYQAGNPIIDYEHNEVLRAMIGGSLGIKDIIPINVQKGSTYTHNFTYNIPDEYKLENIHIVLVLTKHNKQDETDNFIINSRQYDLIDVISSNEKELDWDDSIVNVFPNPNDGSFTLDLKDVKSVQSVIIYNNSGKIVWDMEDYHENEEILINSDLNPGVYLLKLIIEQNKIIHKKLVVR